MSNSSSSRGGMSVSASCPASTGSHKEGREGRGKGGEGGEGEGRGGRGGGREGRGGEGRGKDDSFSYEQLRQPKMYAVLWD